MMITEWVHIAYKLITKGAVARYDNVLVTEPDFFKTLYQEADDNKTTPDINKTTKTISDFILQAERKASEGGSDYLNYGTYYKWYEGVSYLISLMVTYRIISRIPHMIRLVQDQVLQETESRGTLIMPRYL